MTLNVVFFSEDVACYNASSVGDDGHLWHLWSDRDNNYQPQQRQHHQHDVHSNSFHHAQSYPASQPTKSVDRFIFVGSGHPSSPLVHLLPHLFPLFTFLFLSLALPIFFFCPSLPF